MAVPVNRAPLLTIKQVRVINAVATHASLARASEHLNTSQSSLSRCIGAVESALGQRLFQRGWTGMEPTSQGEVVIAHCRRMTSSFDAAQKLLKRGDRTADLSHHLTWDMLRAVSAVKLTGNVSAAAAYLETSQPDVSRALNKVAATIGRHPFQRTRTGMKATEDAELLSDLHARLLLDVTALPEQLEALSGEITGRVAVGLLPFSEQDIVVKAFGKILRQHRHIRLQAVTGSYSALIDGLRQGELDFVLGPLREPPPSATLAELRLYDEFFAIVARPGHPLCKRSPALAELAGESWVVAPHGTPTRRYFETLLLAEGVTPPAQICEIVTFFLAEQMILNSNSIGLLTYSARKRRAISTKMKILPLRLPENKRAIGLTYRKHQPFTPAQEIFRAALVRETPKDRKEPPPRTRDTGPILRSTITCPQCGFAATETMPIDACQHFYACTGCGTMLRPNPGDCCVFCSFGSVPCPPIQSQRGARDGCC